MKAAFGIATSRKENIALLIWTAVVVAIFLFAVFSAVFLDEWSLLISASLNMVTLFCLFLQRATAFIRITDHDRLMIGNFQIEIQSINRIEFIDENTLRVHYIFQEQPRKSSKVRLKENEKNSFLDILHRINPHIEIHYI